MRLTTKQKDLLRIQEVFLFDRSWPKDRASTVGGIV